MSKKCITIVQGNRRMFKKHLPHRRKLDRRRFITSLSTLPLALSLHYHLHLPFPTYDMTSPMDQEAQQQLFTDTLLKLQIHAALAKEHVHHNKSPLPLLAQSCSLLDNIPTSTTIAYWTPAQRNLIDALKIDAWMALADGCIQANDLIQAEASLQRLSTLQDAAAGPLSWRAQKTNKYNHNSSRRSTKTKSSDASSNDNHTSSSEPTKEHRQAAEGLIQTLHKLCQVYTDMGKSDMADNFGKRIQKMSDILQDPVLSSTTSTATTP